MQEAWTWDSIDSEKLAWKSGILCHKLLRNWMQVERGSCPWQIKTPTFSQGIVKLNGNSSLVISCLPLRYWLIYWNWHSLVIQCRECSKTIKAAEAWPVLDWDINLFTVTDTMCGDLGDILFPHKLPIEFSSPKSHSRSDAHQSGTQNWNIEFGAASAGQMKCSILPLRTWQIKNTSLQNSSVKITLSIKGI